MPPRDVAFHPAPFTTSDVIVPEAEGEGYAHHYLIAQCWAETRSPSTVHPLVPGDDAGEAAWFSLAEMRELQQRGGTTQAVLDVVQRGMALRDAGLLHT